MAAATHRQARSVRWPVSRVLSTACADRWPFLWDCDCSPPRATHPDGDPETDRLPSLFGLAPGGACRATSVSSYAVRSYRTISTSPRLSPVRRSPFCFAIHHVRLGGRYQLSCSC